MRAIFLFLFYLIVSNASAQYDEPVLQPKKIYAYEGLINKTIPVKVWIRMVDNILIGQITYDRVGQPVRLRGVFDKVEGTCQINEFEANGTITGILSGKADADGFNGTWGFPKSKNPLSLQLNRRDTLLLQPDTAMHVGNVKGSYHYAYGPEGEKGQLLIAQGKDKSYTLECIGNSPIAKQKIQIKNNRGICQVSGYGQCVLKVRFYKDIALVDYMNGQSDCGGISGAGPAGIYLKTGQ